MRDDGKAAATRDLRAIFGAGGGLGLTDGELLARFAAGDGEPAEAAFGSIVERHGPMVRRVCRDVLRDVHAADDAFQATFLVLARRASGLSVRGSIGPWLHGVARRVAAHARAEAARRVRHERAAGEAAARPDDSRDPDDLAPALHEAIAALPDRYRAAVVLCDLEGMTHDEAASALRCPPGTVKSRLSRGRERLRDRLSRGGLGLAPPPPVEALAPGLAQAAARLATSRAASASVLALSRKAMRTMMLAKLKPAAAALALAGAFAGGAILARPGRGPEPAAPPPLPPPNRKLVGDDPGSEGLALKRLDVEVDDLIAAYGLEIYKFRLELPAERAFSVVFRERRAADAPYRVLQEQKRLKKQEGPTTLLVYFRPMSGAFPGNVLFSKERFAAMVTNCPGCTPSGYTSTFELPLREEAAQGFSLSREDPIRPLGPSGELRLFLLKPVRRVDAPPDSGQYPYAELVVVPGD